jgi:hypothetical protein
MNKIEVGKIESDKTARVLRDDELDAVSGGFSWGVSQGFSWGVSNPGIVVTKMTDSSSV